MDMTGYFCSINLVHFIIVDGISMANDQVVFMLAWRLFWVKTLHSILHYILLDFICFSQITHKKIKTKYFENILLYKTGVLAEKLKMKLAKVERRK